MLLKPDGRIIAFTKFRSRRVCKVEGIFFSPRAFFLFIAARVPFCFFIHKAHFTKQLPVPNLKTQTFQLQGCLVTKVF